MKSGISKKREAQLARAAAQAARQPLAQRRCYKHPDRYAATSVHEPMCWECYLGPAVFRRRFKDQAETFYQPGGPGWAGD